mmetsp:Transcript_14644/g.46592  ORF Transcript_14644/g.46592 Transcript_14644/m.46592 type:complete len:765 (-) Transcript_14644:224-2518(-)
MNPEARPPPSHQMGKQGLHAVPRSIQDRDYELDELEVKLEELETELLEINHSGERLRKSHSELVELQLVLEKAGAFFEDARADASQHQHDLETQPGDFSIGAPLLDREMAPDPKAVRLGFVAGVVLQEKTAAFERVLFRATRGNMYLKHTPIEGTVVDPVTSARVEKSVFVVFFAGERARMKILKICDAFAANRYPFPEDPSRQRQMNAEVTARLRELHTTIDAGDRHREGALMQIGSQLEQWITLVRREKAVYHTLNMLSIDVTRKCLVAEGWCPTAVRGRVQEALMLAARQSSAQVGTIFQPLATRERPPTYFRTNKYTECFQDIVDSYGVARYREANPAVFTMVTFPFLFAVMFGDVGHGVLMFLAASFLLLKEKQFLKQNLNEMVAMAFSGRYCIFLMSVFSIYVGFLYNECFSIPMTLFGKSSFVCGTALDAEGQCPTATTTGLVMAEGAGPYPFGVDPVWHGTRTELPFINSVKMKMSIILGVSQMMLGIVMSFYNHRYFRDSLSVWCEFVPQVLFLMSLFGYLSFLLILKWVTGSTADLYHVMIYMFLSPGDVTCVGDSATGVPACPENELFPGQAGFQVLLVLVAFVCVPWMLFPKPLILKKRHESRHQGGAYAVLADDHGGGDHGGHGGEDFNFGEVAVHQMIHTIEFVLGAVSNTASYLRLWALSLAHAQLSAVFYDRIFMAAIQTGSPVALVVGFFMWAMATIGVLMIMETLSAFLHALRLHWVEYMNKFYQGDGYKFVPFSFAAVDKESFAE